MDWSQGIFDIIGVIIGFVTIILLFSLLVTSLLQATQAVIRLRGRNLRRGIAYLISNVFDKDLEQSKALALKTLNAKSIAILSKKTDAAEKIQKYMGPGNILYQKRRPAEGTQGGGHRDRR